jgi:GntR family phosphonate transport system transcriptional regulator
MPRTTWTMIRDALARDITNGVLNPGDQLPTEPQLAERFDAGRHSVRRAVEALAKEGKLSIEQGRGTFVEATPRLVYTVGRRTRLRRNLVPQGCKVTGDLLGADLVEATETVREALGLPPGAMVVESRRITLADGLPIAFGSVFHAADRFPDFVQRRDVLGSTTEAYRSYGIEDYVRAETQMHARPARPDEAKMLKQHPDLPVIVVRAIDTELDGTPLSASRVIWAAGRVRFTMSGSEDDT